MYINLPLIGVILIIIGSVYYFKPNIFQRWFWKKTGFLQKTLGPKKYLIFMKKLGICLIIIGILFFLVKIIYILK